MSHASSTRSRVARTLVLGVGLSTLTATGPAPGDMASAEGTSDFDGDAEIRVHMAAGVARDVEYGLLTIRFDGPSTTPDAGGLPSPHRLESLDDPSSFVESATDVVSLSGIATPCDHSAACVVTFRVSGENGGTFTASVSLESGNDSGLICSDIPEFPDEPVGIEILP